MSSFPLRDFIVKRIWTLGYKNSFFLLLFFLLLSSFDGSPAIPPGKL